MTYARSAFRTVLVAGILSVLVVAVSACSGSVSFGSADAREAAVLLIEEDLMEQFGLGPLTADCPEDVDTDVGATFDCTAETEDGDVIEVTAEVSEQDDGSGKRVDVEATNLAPPEQTQDFEASAAQVLSEQQGAPLNSDSIDCGDGAIVLVEGFTLDCVLTDPADGSQYESIITITDPENLGFEVEVTAPA